MVSPGDKFDDRYQLIEPLASGGMGAVWRARHLGLEMDVALKVVSPRVGDGQWLERFRREAQAVARLRSPNIVQVLDFGVFEGKSYLVMELLRGEDLAACLARKCKLPAERCVQIVEGMAKAIQFAHDHAVIHRDLKPANIFLERVGGDEVVKVLDFGVAKDLTIAEAHGITSTGTLVGSPAYMSPEQVWSQGIGYPSDVWAMGVVSFELLTGQNPFDDQTLAKVFERIVRAPLPSVRALRPELPPESDAFFERALARSIPDRIPSASEFARQFGDALAGRPTAVRVGVVDPSAPSDGTEARLDRATTAPASLAQPLLRPDSQQARRRRIALSAGLLVVLAAISALVFARTGTRSRARMPAAGVRAESLVPGRVPEALAPPLLTPATAAPEEVVAAPPAPTPANTAPPVAETKPPKQKAASRSKSPAPTAPAPVIDPRFGIPVGP